MENVHAQRSAGWSILCYIALLILASILTNGMPSLDMKPSDAALAIDAHRSAMLWGAWLTFPAIAFLLWFLVGLRNYLACAPGPPEGLPAFALGAGIVMAGTSLWAAMLQTAALYVPPDVYISSGMASIAGAFVFVQGGLGYGPVAIFIFAAAHSMRRHDSAPAWLAMFGYFAAGGAALATLSIFFGYGPMSPGGVGPGIIGALPAAIWLIATGVVLIQNRRGSPVSTSALS